MQDTNGIALANRCLNAGADLIGTEESYRVRRGKRVKASWALRVLPQLWDVPTELATLAIRATGNRERPVRPVWDIAQQQDWFDA